MESENTLNHLTIKELKVRCKEKSIKIGLSNKQDLIQKIIFYNKWCGKHSLSTKQLEEKNNEEYQITIKEQLKKEKNEENETYNKYLDNLITNLHLIDE